jgi:hypothetical protein
MRCRCIRIQGCRLRKSLRRALTNALGLGGKSCSRSQDPERFHFDVSGITMLDRLAKLFPDKIATHTERSPGWTTNILLLVPLIQMTFTNVIHSRREGERISITQSEPGIPLHDFFRVTDHHNIRLDNRSNIFSASSASGRKTSGRSNSWQGFPSRKL